MKVVLALFFWFLHISYPPDKEIPMSEDPLAPESYYTWETTAECDIWNPIMEYPDEIFENDPIEIEDPASPKDKEYL